MRASLCALAVGVILNGSLCGCAAYDTYEKCGVHGCPGDAQITAQVRARFRERSDFEQNAISVQTLDHVVYLSGVVSDGLEVNDAESIASSVPGVTQVVNSMAVSQSR